VTTTLKTLGQAAPSAAAETDLYTVPSSTQALVSSIIVANRSATPTTFRLSISVNGGATATKDYLAFDTPVGANDIVGLTIGATLDAADVIRCYNTLATVSFNLFGEEITP
jgi:hypothetical protein